jgi:hypothetical protein
VLGLIFIGPYKFNVSKTEATRIEGMQLQNYIRSLKSEKEDAIEAARKLRGTIGEIINKPPDPSLVSVGATFRLVGSLRQTLQSAAPITLLLTYTTTENHKAMTELSALISEACGRNAGRLACTVSESDQPVEQSGGVYPISKRQGITIHLREPKADNPILLNSLYRDLSSWFIVTKDSSSISQVIMSRNNKSRDMAFVWMEIGPGSPWKADDARISHGLERLNRELAQVGPDGTTPQGPPE